MSFIIKPFVFDILEGTEFNDLMLIGLSYNATINGLGGNDRILVARSTNSVIDGGDGNDILSVLNSKHGTTTMIGGIGNDTMFSGNGEFSMYGDAGDLIGPVPIYLFFDTNSFTDQVVVFTAPPTGFGDDIMFASKGDDFMSGDAGKLVNNIFFQTAQTGANEHQSMLFDFVSSTFLFGNDTMYGGDGNDTMNGDGDTSAGFKLADGSTSGSTAIADGPNSEATAKFYTSSNTFLFGNDNIFGEKGNDFINGDISVVAQDAAFGVAIATNGGKATSIFATSDDIIAYGDDTISGGKDNDVIYGDGQLNIHTAIGGSASADGSGSIAIVIDTVGIDVHDHITLAPLLVYGGNDTLTGDDGNDSIYGDHKTYYNAITGGDATASNGATASTSFTVDGTVIASGDDTISGGKGNDQLIGDVLSTKIEVFQGTATGVGASSIVEMKNLTQIMGDDIISGGDGKDTIIGDCLDYSLAYAGLSLSENAGKITVSDSHNNSITWGNDTMSGGSGKDNFITAINFSTDVVSKMFAQGNDTITDFNIHDDKLTFVGTDMTTLLSHISLNYSGSDTIINFDGGDGGSITLENVHVNNISDLHIDVLANASSLIGLFP